MIEIIFLIKSQLSILSVLSMIIILFKAKLTYSDGKMTLCLRAVDGKSKDNTIVREIEGDNLVQVRIMLFFYGQTTFKIMSGKEHKTLLRSLLYRSFLFQTATCNGVTAKMTFKKC